jgi:chromosome segregation ATPase
MADKTYTEEEHLAVLEARVNRETTDLTAERDQLTSEKAELESKLDVETAAKVAAEQKATAAEQALTDFRTEIADREAAAAKKDERLKQVREAAKHLDDKFFEDEKRIERIVAMSDDNFEGYVNDLASTATVAPSTNPAVPRETAMQGKSVGEEKVASAGKDFLLRQFVVPASKEG